MPGTEEPLKIMLAMLVNLYSTTFPGVLQQSTMNWMVLNNRNEFSNSYGS